MKKYSNIILIVTGVLIIVSVIFYNRLASSEEDDLLQEYEDSIKQKALQDIGKANEELLMKDDKANDASGSNEPEIDISKGIGILSIPKIELRSLIREGSSEETIRSSLGHVETTAYPGENGNFAVAGHRNYSDGRFFNKLDKVEVGDYVYVETVEAKYTYQITEIKVVEDDDVSVLKSTKEPIITMITCTPAYVYIGAKRLIVIGELVEE